MATNTKKALKESLKRQDRIKTEIATIRAERDDALAFVNRLTEAKNQTTANAKAVILDCRDK